MSFKAFIFDYGGVIRRTVDWTPRRQLMEQKGLPEADAEDLVFGSERWREAQLGQIDSAAFWSGLGDKLDLSDKELHEFREAFWSGDRLDENLIDFIRRVRKDGFQVALLSNAADDLRKFIQELGIADAFDAIVISAEEGVMKPDKKIYGTALERLDVSPEEAIFIDDFQENVEGAREVGLEAVRFRGVAPLRVSLRERGLPAPEVDHGRVPDLEAIIFDWGGVMEHLADDEHVAAWERRLALRRGTLAEALWGPFWRELSVGAMSDSEYNQLIGDRLGFPDTESVERFLEEFYQVNELNRVVLNAVRSLREEYKVALLTNAWPGHAEAVQERYGLDVQKEFDAYVNSAEVKLRKPDPAIYERILGQLDVAAERAVFLDDKLQNVDAARELGIHAIQFVDPAFSLAELEEILGHPIHQGRVQ